MKFILVIALLFSLGCAKRIHLGAINSTDSFLYDILLGDQDLINSAKAQYMAGTLPASIKGQLNDAIDAYNVAAAAWRSYHDARGGDSIQLQQDLNLLNIAIGFLKQDMKNSPAPVPTPTPIPISNLVQIGRVA